MAVLENAKAGTLTAAVCWFALAVTVSFWGAAYMLAQQDRARTLVDIDDANRNLARSLSEHADRTFDYADRVALQIKAAHEQAGRGFDLERFGREGGINRKVVVAIVITDARGDVRQIDVSRERGANVADREHFKAHAGADTGKPVISRPLQTRVLKRPGILLTRRLNRPDGTFDGIVSVMIDPAVFTSFYRSIDLGEKSLIVLTGRDGFVRARNSGEDDVGGQDVRQGELFLASVNREEGATRYPSRVDGVMRRAAFRQLGAYPLFIGVGVAEETVLAEVNNRARHLYAGALAATWLAISAAAALLFMIRRRDRDAIRLRDAMDRYRGMVEGFPDAVFINRGDVIVYANPAALRLLGADSAAQIVGKSPLDIVHPDGRNAVARRIEKGKGGIDFPEFVERRFLRIDGSLVETEVSVSNVLDQGLPARQVVVRDITQRKQIESTLRDSEERYRLLIDTSPDAIIIYTDDHLSFANPAAVKLFGAKSREQLIGLTIENLVHPDGRAAALARRAYVTKSGQPTGLWEQTFLRFDGTPIYVEGSTIGMPGTQNRQRLVIVRDIGARKRAEAALRDSEARMRIAFDAVGMSNWEWDIASDRTHWGHGCEKILGPLPEGAAQYPDFRSMVHAEDRVRFLASGRATMEHGTPYDVEFRFVRTDGVMCWMRSSGRAVRNAEGRIDAIIGIAQDVTQRHDIERELALSRQRSDALMESIPAPAWLKDRDGRFLAVNRAWYTRFNKEPGFAIGRTNAEVFPGPFAVERDREDRQVMETQKEQRIERMTRVDGKPCCFETVKSPVFDERGEVSGIVGVSFDTTAHKQMEEELRLSDERFRQFADAASAVLWMLEPEPLRVLFINRAFENIWGFAIERLRANPQLWSDSVHPEDRARNLAEFNLWRQEPAAEVYASEYRIVRPDGGIRWIRDRGTKMRDAGGRVYRLQGIAEDITEQRNVELALAESRQRRDALIEANPDPAWLKDLQGRYIAVNRAWFTRRGLTPHNIEGKTDREFFSAERRALVEAEDRRVIETKTVVRSERNWKYADGASWIETVKAPVFDSDGNVTAIVGISHDISERKRSELMVQEMNLSLEQKTAELTALNHELESFAYTVSHDLRAPLRHIDGFVNLLKSHAGPTLDAQSTRYFDRVSSAARRMSHLIDDLLAFSRTGRTALRMQPVPLDRLLRETIEHLKPDTEGRCIEWKVGALPEVQGDAGLLAIVLQNLLSNAVKYTRPRKIAQIEISAVQSDGGMTTLTVRDNGVGFDMQYQNKLFGVFQRLHTDAEFEGTGIGLATVARIVQRHGGRVWAESKADEGSSFHAALPLAPKQARVA